MLVASQLQLMMHPQVFARLVFFATAVIILWHNKDSRQDMNHLVP
jgi:hypothetical protein